MQELANSCHAPDSPSASPLQEAQCIPFSLERIHKNIDFKRHIEYGLSEKMDQIPNTFSP